MYYLPATKPEVGRRVPTVKETKGSEFAALKVQKVVLLWPLALQS